MNLTDLKRKPVPELIDMAREMGLDNLARSRKQEVVAAILRKQATNGEDIYGEGTLEILPDGYGFLRSADSSYLAGPDDIYVSQNQIRRFNLRTGDGIAGKIRPPKGGGERYFALLKIDEINFSEPNAKKQKILFENLTPDFPDEKLTLERGNGTTQDLSSRIVDLIAPIGKGQRALIVSPPKAGKTLMLQNIADSIAVNNPDVVLIVLLIDERLTEHKQDVVILLDSITRLARAFNTIVPSSGKVLTGGVDANALERPKRFYGAARNFIEGGSLSIIATALIDTGSRMDEVIYEEFKGRGNLEIHLERKIAEKRVWPAINIRRSGTRREERLLSEDELQRVWILRKLLHDMEDIAAIEFMVDKLKETRTNDEFFNSMRGGR